MLIRSEQEKDFDEIYNLVKTAFETAQHGADGDEQDWVLQLRAGAGYVPSLALVAEEGGKLAGHIMLTKTYVQTATESVEALLLSPIAVLQQHRKKGVGAALINEAMARAKAAGWKAVFLLGDPDYYGRFGFKSVSNYNIEYAMDVPCKYVLVCELQAGWLKNIKGKIAIV